MLGSVVQVRLCDDNVIAREADVSSNEDDAAGNDSIQETSTTTTTAAASVPFIDLTQSIDSSHTNQQMYLSTSHDDLGLQRNVVTTADNTDDHNDLMNPATHQCTTTSGVGPIGNTAVFPGEIMDLGPTNTIDNNNTNNNNQQGSSSSQSPISETAKRLKSKILRSKELRNSKETYKIVPYPPAPSTSHAADASQHNVLLRLLDNLPEPNQNLDDASDAQSLINDIRYSGKPTSEAGAQDCDWTCPNCDLFNLYDDQMCECGTARPTS